MSYPTTESGAPPAARFRGSKNDAGQPLPPFTLRSALVLAVAVALLAGSRAQAHDLITTKITWSREISRIMDRRCLSCHHEGGAAFDFTDYAHVRPWAKAIKEAVLQRRMPPSGAVKGFGDYVEDHSLSQEEIELLALWVEGGAPEGESRELPKFNWTGRKFRRPPKVDAVVDVNANPLVLDKERWVVGIRPAGLTRTSSLRAVARRPDGSVEPLIWLDGFDTRFPYDYYFRTPMNLPAGSQIEWVSKDAGSIALLAADSPVISEGPPRDNHADHAGGATDIDGTFDLTPEELEKVLQSGTVAGIFVCPMDPDVRSNQPGNCSRCGMKLVLGIPKQQEYLVDLTAAPAAVHAGAGVELSFDIRRPDTGEPVYHFQTVHEKLLHMFIVSDDLGYFLHDHPVYGPDGVFRFKTSFPKSGMYRVIADFYPEGGAPQLAVKTLLVSDKPGDLALRATSLQPDLSPKSTANLKAALTTEPAQPIVGMKTLLFFDLKPAEGLEKYLGAWGHMLAASSDLVDLIHNHPFLADEKEGRIQFNMIFPRPGIYRVWVQFQRLGVVNTAVFDVPVEELK